MSERRDRNRTKNRTIAYIAAGVVHAGIIAALLINFTSKTDTVEAVYAEKIDVVTANTVDESQIKKEQDKLKKIDRDKKRKTEQEIRDLKKLKKQADLEKKRLEDLQAERKKIALKKQRDKEKYEKELRERKRKEELAKKRKKEQEELDRIKREEQEYAAQQQMNKMLAEEEAFLAETRALQRTTTAIQQSLALIQDKITSVRTVDPGFEIWRVSVIDVKVSPSGVVLSVRTIETSGSLRYDESVESAVYKASPLPLPNSQNYPSAHRKLVEDGFEFEVKHPSAR